MWVPRPQIVTELVEASGAPARRAVLVASASEIASDCLAVLAEVNAPDLKDLADLAAEAADTLRMGKPGSAQALAANVFDTLLHDVCRRAVILQPVPANGWYRKVRDQIEPVGDGTLIGELRHTCVLAAALPALQSYWPGDPSPEEYACHATAHGASRIQYSDVNAVIAVMLTTSMLREAQESSWEGQGQGVSSARGANQAIGQRD